MRPQLFFLILILVPLFSQAQQVIKYDWLTSGEKSGSMEVTYIDDKHTVTTSEFNDRGRGPKIRDEIWLNDQGMISKQNVSGHAYMGAKVDEQFTLNNGMAQWQNTIETDSQKIQDKAFYSAADGTLYFYELLVKAIAASKEQKIRLLPSGTATFEKITSTQVNHGGQSKTVHLLAIKGFGFSPTYGWFDDNYRLFGFSFGWMGITLQGWGDNLAKLKALQETAEDNYFRQQAKKFSQDLDGITLINNVHVFTATDAGLIKNTQVAIENGKIIAVGKDANIKAARTIDGKGNTLMPGLWDMHSHISLQGGYLNIAAGITSVRDLANEHNQLMEATKLFNNNDAIGPTIYRAGFIDQQSPYSAPTGKLATSLEQALEYIDWYGERGYQQIKIYSSINPEWVPALAKRVHKNNMKLSGHIPSFMTTEQAVKDGFDEIQHINMLFLNFLADKDSDTRTPLRFTLVGDKAGELDLDSKAVKDFIALLKKEDVIVDPTVTIFEGMFLNKAGEIDPSYQAIAEHMPADVRRGFLSSSLDINADNEAAYKRSFQALLKMIKKLHDAGVRLVPGTDALEGFTLHRELELYAQAGISNEEVLKIATVNSARIAGQENVGTIAPGQTADFILLEGNPLENISDIRNVALVFKGEKLYKPNELYQAIGIKPFSAFH
ncbi:amidohydrolase family protein [Thalassomonas viridans]|uniref:Amidohydrolase family protein n=1 Tax=Thalassomonas viridans TaxID=137584 RepID=A0AAF0C9E8_9GAMM|nr:amidohydrolase family protein [Thalassomonas viridans]WDE05160.1 amidohydrolase family protein [Thalassomonas viridans]